MQAFTSAFTSTKEKVQVEEAEEKKPELPSIDLEKFERVKSQVTA